MASHYNTQLVWTYENDDTYPIYYVYMYITPSPFVKFQSWLVSKSTVYGMKLPTRFQLIGQVGLKEYKKWITWFQENQSQSLKTVEPITCRSYARSAITRYKNHMISS